MSEFLVKSKRFTTKHVWFDAEYEKIMGYDKLIIHGAPIMKNRIGRFSCIAIPQETLISDLSLAEENLWGLTTKTVRNEINRSKRENV